MSDLHGDDESVISTAFETLSGFRSTELSSKNLGILLW